MTNKEVVKNIKTITGKKCQFILLPAMKLEIKNINSTIIAAMINPKKDSDNHAAFQLGSKKIRHTPKDVNSVIAVSFRDDPLLKSTVIWTAA
jgi:hypothetical protein